AWAAYQAGDPPELLNAEMTDAVHALGKAVDARNPADARQAAIDVAGAALDLQLRHRNPAEIDLARLDIWARQLLVDTSADDPGDVAGDVATFETIWDRVSHTVDTSVAARIDTQLGDLRTAADDEDVTAAANAVPALRDILARLSDSALLAEIRQAEADAAEGRTEPLTREHGGDRAHLRSVGQKPASSLG
ncbi:MAG: hypothetical protein ACRDTT_27665, partial [Pseudonocardiaceae bacterium]